MGLGVGWEGGGTWAGRANLSAQAGGRSIGWGSRPPGSSLGSTGGFKEQDLGLGGAPHGGTPFQRRSCRGLPLCLEQLVWLALQHRTCIHSTLSWAALACNLPLCADEQSGAQETVLITSGACSPRHSCLWLGLKAMRLKKGRCAVPIRAL